MRCPVCKRGTLQPFDKDATEATMICSDTEKCKSIITMKTQAGKVLQVVVPGVVILSSAIGILKFFEIDNISDLWDMIDSI